LAIAIIILELSILPTVSYFVPITIVAFSVDQSWKSNINVGCNIVCLDNRVTM